MANELPVPDELLHLLEKRDATDRRKAERRQDETDAPAPEEERRSGSDRRRQDRRDSK